MTTPSTFHAQQATDSNRFDYFRHHRGMFSVTGLSDAQIKQLREERGIYIVGGGRVNIAGLRSQISRLWCRHFWRLVLKS